MRGINDHSPERRATVAFRSEIDHFGHQLTDGQLCAWLIREEGKEEVLPW